MTNATKAYLYALLTVLFWSTVATAFKIALQYLDIYQLLFYACFFSVVVLSIPILKRRDGAKLLKMLRLHWRYSLIVACLNPLTYYLVLFAAYDRLPAQIAQPINYTWAIVLIFMSVVFLKQKPTKADFLAAFVCYAGVLTIATQGQLVSFEGAQLPGIALAILSTFIWSAYWILNVNDPRDHQVAMFINFLIALPFALAICLWMSSLRIELPGLLSAAYVGVFEMGLAFLFWSKALRLADNTSRVSTLIFLSPFLSLVFIQEILGETLLPSTYIGLIVIIAGLAIQKLGSAMR